MNIIDRDWFERHIKAWVEFHDRDNLPNMVAPDAVAGLARHLWANQSELYERSQSMTFQELLKKTPKTKTEAVLCQAIAALSTQPQFSHLTPWEVYDHVKSTAQHWDAQERP